MPPPRRRSAARLFGVRRARRLRVDPANDAFDRIDRRGRRRRDDCVDPRRVGERDRLRRRRNIDAADDRDFHASGRFGPCAQPVRDLRNVYFRGAGDHANAAQRAVERFQSSALGHMPRSRNGGEITRAVRKMRGAEENPEAGRRRDDVAAAQGLVAEMRIVRARRRGRRLECKRVGGDLHIHRAQRNLRHRLRNVLHPGRDRRVAAVLRATPGDGVVRSARLVMGPGGATDDRGPLAEGRRIEPELRYGHSGATAAVAAEQEGHHAAVVSARLETFAGREAEPGEAGQSED
ncbi:MAG: hypothetical protein KDJ30_04405, partial [Rhodoblastus sp.]|nr:hypothetical protein [Rhodoblastus sp.]